MKPSFLSARSVRFLQNLFTVIGVTAALSVFVMAQNASTGAVLGTVTDPTGAVVPNAEITLTSTATNQSASVKSNNSGQFTFANVAPGDYRLTIKAEGFQTASINGVTVDVNKTFNAPVQLVVGGTTNVVEVQATGQVELQTTDAQLGNVIDLESVNKLPSLRRDAQDLLAQQPGVNPSATNASNQVRVTGAIDDQNTFTLDGIDITENIVASRTTIPTPDDAVQEFRVDVANPNANFDRSTGGQVNLVARSGSNRFHGSGYEWHQNDELNANSWDNNFLHLKRPELKDNRFGGRIGGPIQHDKTFFFGMYEGRRFPNVQQISRFVPTDTLKQGILRFKDATKNIVSYNLANSVLCSGATGTGGPCDPRGLGISPTVKAFWALEPTGNDPTQGDGLNTIGFRGNVLTPTKTDYTIARLDHTFSERFKFYGTYNYYRLLQASSAQVDIRSGTPVSVISNPNRGDLISAALNMQLRPTLLNVARWGWVRNRDAADATSPTEAAGILNLPGTNSSAGPIALLPGISQTGLIDAPIDLDTQRARFQADFDKDIQYNDDLTWLKGRHQIQTGGNVTVLPYIHERADKVVGSLTSLVAQMDADVSPGGLSIPTPDRPPTCPKGSTTATNCLLSTDVQSWDRLYAASLGLLDNIGVLAVRDGNLNPLPLGTPLINSTHQKAYYFYGQDTFRWTPTFTVTAGLAYGWQTPPSEDLGRQTIIIDANSGKPLTADAYMAAKASAAQAGQVYNPTLGYVPIKSSGRTVYNTDWKDVAPRLALAWNPGPKRFVGKFLGDRKTVIRAGAGITYDRINTVQSVLIPMLGVGFGQNITVVQPNCTVSGAPGANCNISTDVAASVYRVGVDGAIPLPTVPPASNPVVPSFATTGKTNFGETLSFQDDPNLAVGRAYTLDFSIQRELPGNMVIEVAYAGHLARHLPQGVNFAASPYFFKDPASGQTFAQAFDNVATALRNGQPAPVQPWFENQLPGAAALKVNNTACNNAPCPTATALLVSQLTGSFINGNVGTIFTTLGAQRSNLGLPAYNSRQVEELFMRTYEGTANYHGMLVTLRKRTQFGLTFNANYTLSKALDETINNQNSAGYYANSFNPRAEYGPSTYDRRHVFSANLVYDLPFGKGKHFSTGGKLDNVIGGWYMSHVFQAFTGTPLVFTESSQVWGGGIIFPGSTGMMPIGPVPASGLHRGVVGGTTTTGVAVGVQGNPPGGTGINLFSDPAAAWSDFRQILLSQDDRSGRGKAFYGLGFWNDDMELGKNTKITERVNFKASADFFNVFNHPNFQNPSLSLTNPRGFGVVSSQFIPGASTNRSSGSRWIQLGARFEF